MKNPFIDDVFSVKSMDDPWVDSVHQSAWEQLTEAMPSPASLSVAGLDRGGAAGTGLGRALVIMAPRAGFGKSHLVTKFAAGLAGEAHVVPITFDLENEVRWTRVLWSVLEKLHTDASARPGATALDHIARRLFAQANRWLIEKKQVPCAQPVEALAALEAHYLDLFDFGNPEQPVARWFGDHFDRLTPMTSQHFGQRAGITASESTFWMRALCSYAQSIGEPAENRLETLRWAIHAPTATTAAPGGLQIIQESQGTELVAKSKLGALVRLLTLHQPMVFVIDHLDVFYRDGQAGLRIAYFISELRRLAPGALTVVCVNQDVWEATFRSQLPSALEDRLTSGVIPLRGLTPQEAERLIRQRVESSTLTEDERVHFTSQCLLSELFAHHAGRPVSPRAVLRHAAQTWERRRQGVLEPPAAPLSPMPPLPVPPLTAQTVLEAPVPTWTAVEPPSPPPLGAVPLVSDTSALPPLVVMPAPSLLGADTMESLTSAVEALAEAEGAPPVTRPTSPEDSRTAFQALRERIERLRPPGKAQLDAAAALAAATAAPARSSSPADSLAMAFRSTRSRLAALSPLLDLQKVATLLRFAGQHFPIIKVSDVELGPIRGTALQWTAPDGEVLAGLEPHSNRTFWDALALQGTLRGQKAQRPVKLAAFAEASATAPTHPASASWQPGQLVRPDLILLTSEDIAAVGAANDLLAKVAAGTLPQSPADLAALLAQEMTGFWRRFTRLEAADMN
jgi:hypothetical protein